MADVRYNVSELFKRAFGINSPVYIVDPLNQEKRPEFNYSGLEVLPDYYAEDNITSWMGTPIVFPATLKGGSYNRYNTKGDIVSVQMSDLLFPPATMFSFRRAKDITRTKISANGTVKELFGFDDWVIDVKGIALDEPTRSAQEQIAELLKWEELADAVNISGILFEQKKISRICIADWSDGINQGSPGSIPFQFQMLSDEDIPLVL